MSLTTAQHEHRIAAYHETGHGVVALALGVESVQLNLWSRKPKNDLETHYGGRARYEGKKAPNKLNQAAISYAGALAELLLENPETELEDYLTVNDSCLAGLSKTDLKGVKALHPSWWIRAVKKSLALLKKHWLVVADVAFELENNKNNRQGLHPVILSAEHSKWLRSRAYADMKRRMYPTSLTPLHVKRKRVPVG